MRPVGPLEPACRREGGSAFVLQKGKPRRGAGVSLVVRSEADQKSRWTRTRATNWSSVLMDLKMTVEPAVPSGTTAPVALLMAAIGRFLLVSTTRPLSMI